MRAGTKLVCERFEVAHQFATVPELLESGVDPAIVAVVTPAKYMHETIVAAASELTARPPATTTHRRRLAGCDVTPPCSAEHPSVTAIQCEKPFFKALRMGTK